MNIEKKYFERWLVVASIVIRALVGTLLVISALGGCGFADGPLKDRNPDPRALPGTDPKITLERTLADHNLILPAEARNVRFKSRNDSDPYWLELTFLLPCNSAPDFFKQNRLSKEVASSDDGIVHLSALDQVSDKFGLPKIESAKYVLYDDGHRSAGLAEIGSLACRIIVSA